jgi:DNA-binding GntR family transcriptional regulator
MLVPVKRTNLRADITSYLFDAILRGELGPGERIVEGKLARLLGVAQSTLREALQQLEHQGLVRKSDRRGTFVSRLSVRDLEDLYVVRLELEPLAASLACTRMSAEHFEQIEAALAEMQQWGQKRAFVKLLKADLRFHQLIWRFSGNSYLEKALNAVCPPLFASYMMRVVSGDFYDSAKDHEEHTALLEALRKKRPPEVREAFRAMTEVFRLQDVDNLRASEARQARVSVSKQPVPAR